MTDWPRRTDSDPVKRTSPARTAQWQPSGQRFIDPVTQTRTHWPRQWQTQTKPSQLTQWMTQTQPVVIGRPGQLNSWLDDDLWTDQPSDRRKLLSQRTDRRCGWQADPAQPVVTDGRTDRPIGIVTDEEMTPDPLTQPDDSEGLTDPAQTDIGEPSDDPIVMDGIDWNDPVLARQTARRANCLKKTQPRQLNWRTQTKWKPNYWPDNWTANPIISNGQARQTDRRMTQTDEKAMVWAGQ